MPKDIQSIEELLKYTGANAIVRPASKSAERSSVETFEAKMHDVRLKEKEVQTQAKAKASGVPYVDLKRFPISPEALRLVPKEQAERLDTVCFLFTGPEIRLASIHPGDEAVKNLLFELEERHKAHGGIYQISEESLRAAIKAYDSLPKIKTMIKGVQVTQGELTKFQTRLARLHDLHDILQDASVSDVMTIIMASAIRFDTSDVHIEAEQGKIAVRFRIDGVLQEVARLPSDLWKKIVARIKLISGLKINVTDRPQDGRFTIFLKEGDADVRVSAIPTTWGESIVMRILTPGTIHVEFEQLGLRPTASTKLLKEIEKPNGMILTTGPTGSGKTTTLYALLRKLNTPDVKIITLEDPIEYKLEGINQSQIEHAKKYTFATGLRSVLRQDPDIVMVGEIRDMETADVAINAALTGHLMLSTLHTNDASGAIPRFISMGVKPFLLAPALNAIIGQRLARRICSLCKQEVALEADKRAVVKKILSNIGATSGERVQSEETWKFYRGTGCDVCNGSGYKGRIGLYEILTMTDAVKSALSESVSEYQMRGLAKEQGMITIVQDGMLKVLEGITTVEEVVRVAGEE